MFKSSFLVVLTALVVAVPASADTSEPDPALVANPPADYVNRYRNPQTAADRRTVVRDGLRAPAGVPDRLPPDPTTAPPTAVPSSPPPWMASDGEREYDPDSLRDRAAVLERQIENQRRQNAGDPRGLRATASPAAQRHIRDSRQQYDRQKAERQKYRDNVKTLKNAAERAARDAAVARRQSGAASNAARTAQRNAEEALRLYLEMRDVEER